MRVGLILQDLQFDSAPARYQEMLLEKLAASEGVTPVGVYWEGDPEAFPYDIDLLHIPDRCLPRWDKRVQQADLDVIHHNGFPRFALPAAALSTVPVIVTMHGSWNDHWQQHAPSHVSVPTELKQANRIRYLWQVVERIGKYPISRLLTVSGYLTDIYRNQCRYPDEMVLTSYQGINDRFFNAPRTDPPADIPELYFLHVSSADPRKNVRTILQAYKKLSVDGVLPDIVIAGGGWEVEVGEFARRLGIEDHVHFTGYVSLPELIQLYDHAEMFLFPSYHETFGLPNVEAMARETPVITSATGAIPEVVGEAAVTIDDPSDSTELADAIIELFENPARAQQLRQAGAERAKQFTWRRHIAEIRTIYNEVA